MPYDYKKMQKELYLPPERPVLVDVPEMSFLMVDGAGDPNGNPGFQDAVGALYSLSYTMKMLPKKNAAPEGYFEFSVLPLEGLWWLSDGAGFRFDKRDNWLWTVMIRQPDFITQELIERWLPDLRKKKPNLAYDGVRLERYHEGPSVQIMHVGPYDTEPTTVARMDELIAANGLVCDLASHGKHHEIYLSDPNRSSPEGRKTVLRHPVMKLK